MTAYCRVQVDVECPLPISPVQFGLCHHLIQLVDIKVKGDSQVLSFLQAGLGERHCEEEVLQGAPKERRKEGGYR